MISVSLEQELFNLGITSHMANVVFDKQVGFCERYMEELHEAVGTLFREGPTKAAAQHAQNLAKIHRENAAWIPKSMALKLQPFERALLGIATRDNLISAWAGSEGKHEARSALIDEMYDEFSDVIGYPRLDGKTNLSSDAAAENVKERIRSILGVQQLTDVRQRLIERITSGTIAGA